ncbi:MAG: prepilin-type N-terminal cleavage/methylation domain-containing protein [Kiritimatiellae bacterium]|nr:prepilin-type N-terminal cleavage/methylation domain-containing protein [Kiritimatiellia bacterium]
MLGHWRHGKRCSGFTLVEAVISSALFFIIAGSFIAAYISAMRTHKMSSDYYKATCIARNRVQRARTVDFESLPLLAEDDAKIDQDGDPDTGGQFRRTTLVSSMAPACKRISVNVQFPLPGGGVSPAGVSVHTMIAEGM